LRRPIADPISQSSREVHERPLTQTVHVASADAVPPGYQRVGVTSPAIFAKVQVLSSKIGRPIFVETASSHSERRLAYWIHGDVIPELAAWLRYRVFPLEDLVDDGAA